MPNMKETFAKQLIELLEKEPLEKISVKDLISACGVSRQSFYYYFSDIYDIVEWIFTEEADKVLRDYSDIESWEFGYVLMMKWVLNHRALVQNTYNSIRRGYVEFFMNRVLYSYIIKVVEDAAVGMNVTNDQKEFIAKFYTLAINVISLEWIREGLKEEPEAIARKVNLLIKGDFHKALRSFEQENSTT